MKKAIFAIVALFIALASFGQADVYKSAHFDGATCINYINGAWAHVYSTAGGDLHPVKTFDMWVKIDSVNVSSNSYLLDVPGRDASATFGTGDKYAIYISPDTTLYCVKNDSNIHTKLHDTDWHHIAFICDTISGHDTLTMYIDGTYATGALYVQHNYITVYDAATADGTFRIGGHYNISGGGASDEYFHGNMSNFTIADSAIYDAYPNCVYDTTTFWSGGTISAPYVVMIALSTDNNLYFANGSSGAGAIGAITTLPITYTLGASPCAPVYRFYCPPAIGTTIYTQQVNRSYKKGAHMSAHSNGWTGAATTITYGTFTDSITIATAGTYQYMDDYHTVLNLDTTVVVIGTGVHDVYNVNDIKIYPNPSTGDFNVTTGDPVTLVICDAVGRIVYNTNVTDKTMIHLSHGMYICTTTNKITNVVNSTKILIQ